MSLKVGDYVKIKIRNNFRDFSIYKIISDSYITYPYATIRIFRIKNLVDNFEYDGYEDNELIKIDNDEVMVGLL